MGYERTDRRYGRDPAYGYRGERQGGGRHRGEYDRNDRPPADYDYEERGFFDRAGDEVRSWFGDEEAERRRRYDERNEDLGDARDRYSSRYGRSGEDRPGGYDRGAASFREYGTRNSGGSGASGGGFGAPRYEGYGRAGSSAREYEIARNAGQRSRHDHDPNYHAWRDRQIEALDRDYDDYRRENQSRFDNDFSSWRQQRTTQRSALKEAREHQEVVGSDGTHVGTVDHVRGDRILLTKTDKDSGGHHHSIPCAWIESVSDKVKLNRTADQAQQAWREEERNRAIGNEDDWDRDGGPHNLNRAFSGTY